MQSKSRSTKRRGCRRWLLQTSLFLGLLWLISTWFCYFSLQKHTQLRILRESWLNTTVLRRERTLRRDAICYLAQKKHSSYKRRDSYGLLTQSLQLLHTNYLSQHADTTDVFIFHTGDFDSVRDLEVLDEILQTPGIVRLVDLTGSSYWQRPSFLKDANSSEWDLIDKFSEGYRHMCRFFGYQIFRYFRELSMHHHRYDYILRLDEDSFLHSPISYNIFHYMRQHEHVYGFRLCTYEMASMKWAFSALTRNLTSRTPQRPIDPEMCGIYNNFFIASVDFFTTDPVATFLQQVEQSGWIYRKNLGDLRLHSMVVYGYASPSRIHRFLDFTYEHKTVKEDCVAWGGIQAGYKDVHATATLDAYFEKHRHCPKVRRYTLNQTDLSPGYQHHNDVMPSLQLDTVMAGGLELKGRGNLSG